MSTAHTAITLRVVTSRVGVALGDQNLPLLPQPFAKTFGAETFAKLFHLTYRIDFLLQFGLLFNPECTFNDVNSRRLTSPAVENRSSAARFRGEYWQNYFTVTTGQHETIRCSGWQ